MSSFSKNLDNSLNLLLVAALTFCGANNKIFIGQNVLAYRTIRTYLMNDDCLISFGKIDFFHSKRASLPHHLFMKINKLEASEKV